MTFKTHLINKYDNPGVQTEIRGIIRYGVDDDTIPDVAVLDVSNQSR